jgi:predicted lipoprotein
MSNTVELRYSTESVAGRLITEAHMAFPCEQVTFIPNTEVEESCSTLQARHQVMWRDNDGVATMNMCKHHRDRFMDDHEAVAHWISVLDF